MRNDMAFLVILFFYFLSTLGYVLYFSIQKDVFRKIGQSALLIGFIIQTLVIGVEYFNAGQFPVQNLHETLAIMAWATAGVFMILGMKINLKILGAFVAPFVTILMIAALHFPNINAEQGALFKTIWLPLHIITVFTGEAAFAMAFFIGILYLVQENAIKAKKRGYFYKRLPSLELIDHTGYVCIIIGFTTITAGLITGMIYAKLVWGRFWGWDPKEVWSGISWLVYAILLHQRLTVGWRGRNAAVMAIIGFFILTFTFLGVNLLLGGHHGTFTKW